MTFLTKDGRDSGVHMVFERIKKIFRGEPPKEKIRSLSLEELEREIENLEKEAIEGGEKSARALLGELQELSGRLKSAAGRLSEAETTEEVHLHLQRSAEEAKRLLTSKVSRAAEEINPPSELTWESLQTFGTKLEKNIELLKGALTYHGRYVGMLFEREMKELAEPIRRLRDLSGELDRILERGKSRVRELTRISSAVAEYRSSIQNLRELNRQQKTMTSKIEKLQKARAKEAEELENLIKSKAFQNLEDLKRKQAKLEEELKTTEKSILLALSPVSRPLRKMRKLASTGKYPLDRGTIQAIDSYLDNPIRAALSEIVELPKLSSILGHLKQAILEEKIELDPRERQKKLRQISDLLENRRLIALRARHERLETELRAVTEKCNKSPILEQKRLIERSLESLKAEMERTKNKLAEIGTKISRTRCEVEKTRKKVQELSEQILGIQVEFSQDKEEHS